MKPPTLACLLCDWTHKLAAAAGLWGHILIELTGVRFVPENGQGGQCSPSISRFPTSWQRRFAGQLPSGRFARSSGVPNQRWRIPARLLDGRALRQETAETHNGSFFNSVPLPIA